MICLITRDFDAFHVSSIKYRDGTDKSDCLMKFDYVLKTITIEKTL